MSQEFQEKVFLLTGGTEGIGKAAALDFAKRGVTLVLVGRNKEKSERVVSELKQQSNNKRIELLLGDMSKLSDIRDVAARFKAKYDRLDVLANNAGAVFNQHSLTEDGIELTFALNHIGYFLLTHELLDVLKKTPGARVISTSSNGHMLGKIDLATIATSKRRSFFSYCDSKLANVLFTRELARKEPGIVVNCFHPGYVYTGFALNNEGIFAAGAKLGGRLFARTPEKGAETLIWLATSPEAAQIRGEYLFDCKIGRTKKATRDEALAKNLWKLSADLCGISA
jgi:retinol dehydrogenase-12